MYCILMKDKNGHVEIDISFDFLYNHTIRKDV